MLVYIYSDSTGSTIDITDRCRVPDSPTGGRLQVKDQAEEGAVAISSLIVDDPDGDIEFTGHRRLYIYEDTAPVNNQVIFNGFTANERLERGPYRTGRGRQWTLDLADPNVLINRRILRGEDANRPAENDLERIQALMAMTELNTVDDDQWINITATTVPMDAADYTKQRVGAYIDDCRQASGKNAYIDYTESLGQYALWYDFANSTLYDSGCFLSNTLADIDQDTTFEYSQERTYLNTDPSRIASGVQVDYDGGDVYVLNEDTLDAFAAIDMDAQSSNVKTETKATARANRYLADGATEHQIIHTVVMVPRAKVNSIKKGHLVSFKSTYMTGFEEYQVCRVLNRTVTEISEDPYLSFELEMDLDPVYPPLCETVTEAGEYPHNGGPISLAPGNVVYFRGGLPGPGYAPNPGYVGDWHFPSWDNAGVDYASSGLGNVLYLMVQGEGTIQIRVVQGSGGPTTLTAELQHEDPITGNPVVDETQADINPPGADTPGYIVTFNVSSHDGEFCDHRIEFRYAGGTGFWGFDNFIWTPA